MLFNHLAIFNFAERLQDSVVPVLTDTHVSVFTHRVISFVVTLLDFCRKFLSCVGYPSCKAAVWFPDTVLEVSRDDSVCPTCRPHPVNM